MALAALLAVLQAAIATDANAFTELVGLDHSPDVSTVFAGVEVADEDVASDDLAGTVLPWDVGVLPGAVDVVAYHPLPNGDQLVAFDVATTLPGGLTAVPGDVVRWDGVAHVLEFDARTHGVPAGTVTDAVTVLTNGDLLLSFDTTVALGGVTADDEDLVAFDGDAFSLLFDGSAAGVTAALDLDAAHYLAMHGTLLLSFDGSGTLGGIDFDDEDVLEYDPLLDAWALAYDGSAHHADWLAADLDALAALAAATTTTSTSTSSTSSTTPPPELLTGRTLRLKDKPGTPSKRRLLVLSKDRDLTLGRGNESPDDPTEHGGTLRVRSASGDFDTTYPLPRDGWRHRGPRGANEGYRYGGAPPVRKIVVRPGRRIKVVAKGDALQHDLGTTTPEPVEVVLTLGAQRYCLHFGGKVRFKAERTYRAKRAPRAPGCPQ